MHPGIARKIEQDDKNRNGGKDTPMYPSCLCQGVTLFNISAWFLMCMCQKRTTIEWPTQVPEIINTYNFSIVFVSTE